MTSTNTTVKVPGEVLQIGDVIKTTEGAFTVASITSSTIHLRSEPDGRTEKVFPAGNFDALRLRPAKYVLVSMVSSFVHFCDGVAH